YTGLSFSQSAFAEGCTNTSQSDTLSFGQHSSIDIVKTEQTASSTNAGLECQGSFLTLLGNGNNILAQLSSTNNGRLVNTLGDSIPYEIYADPQHTMPIQIGTAFDYNNSTLLDLLGIFGATNEPFP